jgi:hypothetical protein
MLTKPAINNALNTWAAKVVATAKANLTRGRKRATGTLYNSVKYKLVQTPTGPYIEFLYVDYGEYVEGGRRMNAKFPPNPSSSPDKPPSPILKWIKVKGIRGRDKQGRFISDKSLTYLISRSISKKGIKPFPFYADAIKSAIKRLGPELGNIIAVAIRKDLNAVSSAVTK